MIPIKHYSPLSTSRQEATAASNPVTGNIEDPAKEKDFLDRMTDFLISFKKHIKECKQLFSRALGGAGAIPAWTAVSMEDFMRAQQLGISLADIGTGRRGVAPSGVGAGGSVSVG